MIDLAGVGITKIVNNNKGLTTEADAKRVRMEMFEFTKGFNKMRFAKLNRGLSGIETNPIKDVTGKGIKSRVKRAGVWLKKRSRSGADRCLQAPPRAMTAAKQRLAGIKGILKGKLEKSLKTQDVRYAQPTVKLARGHAVEVSKQDGVDDIYRLIIDSLVPRTDALEAAIADIDMRTQEMEKTLNDFVKTEDGATVEQFSRRLKDIEQTVSGLRKNGKRSTDKDTTPERLETLERVLKGLTKRFRRVDVVSKQLLEAHESEKSTISSLSERIETIEMSTRNLNGHFESLELKEEHQEMKASTFQDSLDLLSKRYHHLLWGLIASAVLFTGLGLLLYNNLSNNLSLSNTKPSTVNTEAPTFFERLEKDAKETEQYSDRRPWEAPENVDQAPNSAFDDPSPASTIANASHPNEPIQDVTLEPLSPTKTTAGESDTPVENAALSQVGVSPADTSEASTGSTDSSTANEETLPPDSIATTTPSVEEIPPEKPAVANKALEKKLPATQPEPNGDATIVDKDLADENLANEKVAALKSTPPQTASKTPKLSDAQYQGVYTQAWLAQQPANHFSIQLVGVEGEAKIKKFIRTHDLPENSAYYSSTHNGKNWYRLVTGIYPDRTAATRAISQLPKPLRAYQPWVRDLNDVQGEFSH